MGASRLFARAVVLCSVVVTVASPVTAPRPPRVLHRGAYHAANNRVVLGFERKRLQRIGRVQGRTGVACVVRIRHRKVSAHRLLVGSVVSVRREGIGIRRVRACREVGGEVAVVRMPPVLRGE